MADLRLRRLMLGLIVFPIWAVFGAYIWVPAIVIGGIAFLGSVIVLAVTQRHQQLLEKARSTFIWLLPMYIDGFKSLWRFLYQQNSGSNRDRKSFKWCDRGVFSVILGLLLVSGFWIGLYAAIVIGVSHFHAAK